MSGWLMCPGLRAPPRYLLFTPAAGAGGARRARVGQVEWLGVSLCLAPEGDCPAGDSGKNPRLTGDGL